MSGVRAGVVTLNVPLNLKKRKLYCFVTFDVYVSSTENAMYASIELFRNLTSIGKLPMNAGVSKSTASVIPRSLVAVCRSFSSPTSLPADCLKYDLAGPQVATKEATQVFLLPFNFEAEIDTVKFNIDNLINVIDIYRVILAMVSTL